MRIKLAIAEIVMCAGLAAVSGCNKEQPAAETQAPKPAEGLASETTKAVDAAKTVAKEATDQATAQAKAAEEQTQGLIDRAKSLVAENKYAEALSSLNQLTTTKLTAEQQKLVDGLKAQIQTALTKATGSDAASALGGALGGKK
jgi:hypothetical protein